ncbi:MAG: XdhC family protein [Cyclobacteriaceae bacterium]|nr:XdhC family protein [Cyclobacteriaceae bacterium]
MKELKTILKAYSEIDFSKRKAAIATVVKVRGSSYRSPGARMVIMDDGKWIGSISGGCLEGDALRKARQVMADNKPMAVTYDTREESNQNLGIGLGCNGVIDVLIEPLGQTVKRNPINLFETILSDNKPVSLATIFSPDFSGEKFSVDEEGNNVLAFTDEELTKTVKKDLLSLFATKKSFSKKYGNTEVFLELIQPVFSIILFGGGFDARPVSTMAKSLGWDVSVTDECVAHIAPVFFPDVDNLSLCKRDFIDRDFNITPYTACVLMSHNYEYDRDVLKKLLKTDSPYIGILGPRKRFDKMLEEFSREDIHLSTEDILRIHSPIGLDIGAETPDEIAISILAEIQSKFSNRSGGFLKYRNSPIHPRDTDTDQVFKQVYLNNPKNKSVNG